MDHLTARPWLLKQANISLIRKTIIAKGTATRAEIAEETKISSTTIRSLLNEMMENGEIESIGYDESSGGRKAERYSFRPERYHGVAFCISGAEIHGLLVNTCGEIEEITHLEAKDGNRMQAIITFLDELMANREIKAIGLGVPGIVEGGSYKWVDPETGEWRREDIGQVLAERYGVPVVMENDLNAITIGFGKCYEKEFPEEKSEQTNMAYLHFEKGCISAGFIAGGRIIRGHRNFAGELGLVPMGDEKLLDDCMNGDMSDTEYAKMVTQVVCWICGILNPEYVTLGGPNLRKDCIGSVANLLSSLMPGQMAAEILYSADSWYDYHSGLAFLTAEKMFDEVQFIKE